MGRFQRFLSELRRRRVIRALLVWGVVAFAVLQVYEPVMHGLHLPEWTLSFVVVVLGLGFPITAALAWAFDVTPAGIERTRPAEGETPVAAGPGPGRGARLALLLGLGVAAAAPGMLYFFVWPGAARHPGEVPGAVPAAQPAPLATALLAQPAPLATALPAQPAPLATALPAQPAPSIGVLPLVNLSSDKEQEYFSDGLTEELLNLLAKVPGLRVAARTSAFAFKGKNEDLRTVGQKLNVSHVLEGSVRKSGGRIRITTQLINVSDGYHLWSETYDRKVTDVFAVQDEIATAVVAALRLKLLQAPSSKDRRTANLEAYNQYLLGRQFLQRNNLADQRRAAQAFRKAVELDPGYAPAWADLATALFWVADMAESGPAIAAGQQEAMAAAEKAVALGPDLADGYLARGFILGMVKWDWARAEVDLQRALAIAPENPRVLNAYAEVVLGPKGRTEEAAATLRKSVELDPLNAASWDSLGDALLTLGRLGPARQALDRSLEINPTQTFPAVHVATCLLLEKQPAEALSWAQRSPEEVFRLVMTALAQHDLGDAAASRRALDELVSKYAYGAAYQIAEVHAWRGEQDAAFVWLDRALAQHDTGMVYLKADLMLRPLRRDPRYAALLRAVNLPAD